MKEAPEAHEVQAEVIPEADNQGAMALAKTTELEQIDATIALANRLDELEKAKNRIRKFIFGRALPGDWVRFKGPTGEAVLSMSGAGAERAASDLGVNFRDWESEKETGHDEHGDWLTWWYRCKAVIGGLERNVMGRASSRDKFFGFAESQWKPLQDVSEPNIRMAAYRNCQKEGVRQLFGLRAISETAAAELGLNLGVVRGWEFGSQGQHGKAAGAAPLKPSKPGELIEVDATGVNPSKSPAFGLKKGIVWAEQAEKDLLWYQGAAEKNIGGQYHAGGVSNLMAIQAALVTLGHAPKFKFVDKNSAPESDTSGGAK
jgi:hypothetical protein